MFWWLGGVYFKCALRWLHSPYILWRLKSYHFFARRSVRNDLVNLGEEDESILSLLLTVPELRKGEGEDLFLDGLGEMKTSIFANIVTFLDGCFFEGLGEAKRWYHVWAWVSWRGKVESRIKPELGQGWPVLFLGPSGCRHSPSFLVSGRDSRGTSDYN